MYRCFYELKRVPDFSLNKYSSLSETGPSGVITQHNAFWRQMNQWGKLFQGRIHLLYRFSPEKETGERMQIILCLEAKEEEAIICVKELMKASVLAPYYDQMKLCTESSFLSEEYKYEVNLFKKERSIESTENNKESFFTASEWKINQNARLYSMMKMLAALNKKCVYIVSLYPVDYCDKLKSDLSYPMSRLRDLSSFRVKTGGNSVSSAGKDEGAKQALKYYEDLLEQLAASPHFMVNVHALCENENCAKMILDSAASEALQEGTYDLYGEQYGGDIIQILEEGFQCLSEEMHPESLMVIPYLYTVEEVSAIAVLPVLYPGETIELPKETVPERMEGMFLGRDRDGHEIYYPWSLLPKHGFLAGMPGSGKTNTMMYLVNSMYKAGIPVLVMEPAKKEYRVLSTLEDMKGITLFSPSANSLFPIHINPFEFPEGMKLSEHINNLLDVFNGTFQLDPPMPMLLAEGVQNCYEELGWISGMINTGDLEYPTMSMLFENIKKLFNKYQYAADVRMNLESVLRVRIGSLTQREMGDIFDVKKSTFRPEEWIEKSAVMELASLGTAPTNFMMLMLLTLIREVLGLKPYLPDLANDNKPRHVIFLEEAHNLIANTSVQTAGSIDPKIAATAFIKDMLAEVRALGEGIIIADQLPTAMASEVVKNTSLKIGLRLTSEDERRLLGETMSADSVQIENMGIFTPGQCIVGFEKLLKPFEMRIPEFKAKEDVFNDSQLFARLVYEESYYTIVRKSFEIIGNKYQSRLKKLTEESDIFIKRYERKWMNWKKRYSAAGGNDAIRKEIRSMRKEYAEIVESFTRLSAECFLYYGLFEKICRILEECKTETKLLSSYKKLRKHYLDRLIGPAKQKREKFIETMKETTTWDQDVEYLIEQLKKQQMLIREIWK